MRLLVVLGSGGHTSEMTALVSAFCPAVFSQRAYVTAATDKLGAEKAQAIEFRMSKGGEQQQAASVWRIPRSREVGQSFLTSFFTTLYAIIAAFSIVLRQRPDLVVVNGPGTCIPICIATLVCRPFASWRGRVVYVESIARVKSLSLSGRILYNLRLTDLFFVQWESLQKQYPRTTYAGRLY